MNFGLIINRCRYILGTLVLIYALIFSNFVLSDELHYEAIKSMISEDYVGYYEKNPASNRSEMIDFFNVNTKPAKNIITLMRRYKINETSDIQEQELAVEKIEEDIFSGDFSSNDTVGGSEMSPISMIGLGMSAVRNLGKRWKVRMQYGLPLNSCGYQMYLSEIIDERLLFGGHDSFTLRRANKEETKRLNHYMLARAILDAESVMRYLKIPNTIWNKALANTEQKVLKHSGKRKFLYYLYTRMTAFVDRVNDAQPDKFPFAAWHGCGGGVFSLLVDVKPAGSAIEMISAIEYEDCRRRGKDPEDREQCPNYLADLSGSGMVQLSGNYYYRISGSKRLSKISVNKYYRSQIQKLKAVIRSGTLDAFDADGVLCFRGEEHFVCE